MTLFTKMLKLDKAGEISPGGEPPVIPAVVAPVTASVTPLVEKPSEFDELGYKIIPKVETPKDPAVVPPVEKKLEDKTGYEKEPVVEVVVPPVVAPVVPPVLDDIDKALVGLPKQDADDIKAFAVENNLTPEVAQKWAAKVKANIELQKVHASNMEKQVEQQKQQTRALWYKDLKDSQDFGGADFDKNVLKANKVLTEFMPQTEKALTQAKSVLPPYVMRDLAKMADHLYATDKLTVGDPIVPTQDEKVKDDALEYYT